jgi:hypothetical protein
MSMFFKWVKIDFFDILGFQVDGKDLGTSRKKRLELLNRAISDSTHLLSSALPPPHLQRFLISEVVLGEVDVEFDVEIAELSGISSPGHAFADHTANTA